MIIKKASDLEYVRFKLEHTYSCYVCRWAGGDNEVGEEHKESEQGGYCSLYCPKCFNKLLSTESKKVYCG